MPKDYLNGKIYQMEPICDHEEGDVYIGSTCQEFISRRLAEHIYSYKKWKNGKNPFISSFSLFEKYGIANIRIILLETFPCNSNDELRSREAYHQKQNKCVNKFIAFRSKEENQEYKKQYSEVHKEDLKQYREEHRDEKIEYDKKYREENHEEIKQKQKKYREEHKQEISEKAKEIITCECGREVRKYKLKRHQRTDIHKELMLQLHEVEKKNDAI